MGFTRDREHPDAEGMRNAKAGLVKAKEAMLSGKYDIIVLDEINTAHFFHLVTVEEILDVCENETGGCRVSIYRQVCSSGVNRRCRPGNGNGRSQTLLPKGMLSRKGIEE